MHQALFERSQETMITNAPMDTLPSSERVKTLRWSFLAVIGMLVSLVSFVSPLGSVIFASSGLFIWASLARPRLPLYLVIILLTYASIQVRLWGDVKVFFTLTEVAIVFLTLIWLITRHTVTSINHQRLRDHLPLVLLVLSGWASLTWTDAYAFGFYYMVMFQIGIVLFFVTIELLTDFRSIMTSIYILVGAGVINASICFYSLVSKNSIEDTLYVLNEHQLLYLFNPESLLRGQGFMHPLFTAYYLSVCLMLLFGIIYTSNVFARFPLSLLIFVCFVALLTTLSKGPLLSFLCGFFVLMLWNQWMNKNLIVVCTLLIAAIIIGFMVSRLPTDDLSKALDYTSKTSTQTKDESSSLGSRIKRWKLGVRDIFDSHGMGTGSGGFYEGIKPDYAYDNVYLHILTDYGFLGMWLYMWFIFKSFVKFIDAYKRCKIDLYKRWIKIYIATFVTLLMNGFTSLTHTIAFIWFFVGLGYALSNIAVAENRNDSLEETQCSL